ncbi:Methyltransferase domain-containing protein [[Candida] zeylanoides]
MFKRTPRLARLRPPSSIRLTGLARPAFRFASGASGASKTSSWRSLGIWLGEQSTQQKLTKVYVGGFGVCAIFFYFYMRDKYHEEMFNTQLKRKFLEDPDALNEYQHLRLKLVLGDALKVREQRKYDMYQAVRREGGGGDYAPSEADLSEWMGRQRQRPRAAAAAAAAPAKEANPSVVAARDTTAFYDEMAAAYDDQVKWEERSILMGWRRRQMMHKLQGDVLEVACGTGRNIPYLDLNRIESVTFLDSSPKMVEVTRDKFRREHPSFRKAAFTVGRAEDLVALAGDDAIKYDTIVETFGLCSHEDPVLALRNMQRLLRPGGRIVLLEHGRSTYDFINNHLDFRAEKRMQTWACRWNLDIGELIEDAGLDVTYQKRVHLGTTWMLVCKRPEDPVKPSERGFLDKLLGRGARPERD